MLNLKLTEEQTICMNEINKFKLDNDQTEFKLGGYAGTGKTFTIAKIIEQLENNNEQYILCAPSGKAVSVLKRKLNELNINTDPKTIHSIFYSPYDKNFQSVIELKEKLIKNPKCQKTINEMINLQYEIKKKKVGSVKFTEKNNPFEIHFERIGKLFQYNKNITIIIDEASMMIPYQKMRIAQLKVEQGYKIKVIYVGDCGQLPPVKGYDWFTENNMNFILQNIQRQKLDSNIIKASMDIRKNGYFTKEYNYEDFKMIRYDQLTDKQMIEYEQIITGKNNTKNELNKRMRQALNIQHRLPRIGEKLICTHNRFGDDGTFIFINGNIAKVINDFEFVKEIDLEIETLKGGIEYENIKFNNISFYDFPFENLYSNKAIEIPRNELIKSGLEQFDYGYAITVHKMQGSEADSVIIYDDKMKINMNNMRKRWLYTALTRASKKALYVG